MQCKFSEETSNPEQELSELNLEILQYMLDLEELQRLAVKAKKSYQILLTRAESKRKAKLEENNFLV